MTAEPGLTPSAAKRSLTSLEKIQLSAVPENNFCLILRQFFAVDLTFTSTAAMPSEGCEFVEEWGAPATFDYKQTSDWKRFKIFRACGYTALGVGIPTTLAGLFLRPTFFNNVGNKSAGTAMIVAGGSLTLIGLPLVMIANNYRKKAEDKAISVSLTALSDPQGLLLPGVTLAVRF